MNDFEKDAFESAMRAHLKAMNYICKTYGYSVVSVTSFTKMEDGQQINFNMLGSGNVNAVCLANAQAALDSFKETANG